MVALADVFRRKASACGLQEPRRSSSTTACNLVSDEERSDSIGTTCLIDPLTPLLCTVRRGPTDAPQQMDCELSRPRAPTTILVITRRSTMTGMPATCARRPTPLIHAERNAMLCWLPPAGHTQSDW